MTHRIGRSLLLVFALFALPGFALAADTSGADKLGWKLALQCWTNNKESVVQSIELAQKIGVKYLECYPGQAISPDDKGKFGPEMTDAQIETVLKKCKDCNVQLINCGVIGIPGKEEDAKKFFAWAKKVGISTIVSEPAKNSLPMIDKVAGEAGIKVAIHDHPKPSQYWNPDELGELVKDLKNVGFCADVGHWRRSGLDPLDCVKKHADKFVSLHFKDVVPTDDKKGWHDTVWGTGDSKAADMLAVLKQKGFKGSFSIEYEYKWDVPTLQKCVEFFNSEANKLAK